MHLPQHIDEDMIFGTLISLSQQQRFRSAWTFLKQNINPDHPRVYNAGIILQHLSNQYGDIGKLKDDCVLRFELTRNVEQLIAHLTP
jgi:hypothetical protein